MAAINVPKTHTFDEWRQKTNLIGQTVHDNKVELDTVIVPRLDGRIDDNVAEISSIKATYTTLGQHQDQVFRLDGRIDDADAEISSIKATYTTLAQHQDQVFRLDGRVDDLTIYVGEEVARLDGRIDDADAEISSIKATYTTLAQHQDQVFRIDGRLIGLDGEVVRLDGRIDDADVEISSIKATYTTLAQHQDQVFRIDGRIDDADDEIILIKANYALQTEIVRVDGRIDTTNLAVTQIQNDYATKVLLSNEVGTINTRIDGVDDEVSSIKATYTTLGQHQDQVFRLDERVDGAFQAVEDMQTTISGEVDLLPTTYYTTVAPGSPVTRSTWIHSVTHQRQLWDGSAWIPMREGWTATSDTGVNRTLTRNEFCAVTAAGRTITLPTSPSDGDRVGIAVGNFTNTVVGRNGQNIQGLAENVTIDQINTSIVLTFVNTSIGWRIE